MLQAEYSRIAKIVDYVSIEQAKGIIGAILEKVKEDFGAMIVDVWVQTHAENHDILEPYLNLPWRTLVPIIIGVDNDETRSLLMWVAEKKKPLWLDRIEEKATSAVDCFSGEPIPYKYMKVDSRTRSYAAIPIWYHGRVRGILAAESQTPSGIRDSHVRTLLELEPPTAVLLWKSGFFKENYDQTQEAIKDFCSMCLGLASSPLNPYWNLYRNPHRSGFIARPFGPEAESLARPLEAVFGGECIRALSYKHEPGRGLVVDELLTQIRSAHFGIADITGLNHNVLIELGAMLITSKPVILLRKKTEDPPPPFNINGYQIYTYEETGLSSIGSSIKISDPTSSRFLDDFVHDFIRNTLMRNSMFRDAKEWVPGKKWVPG